LGGDDDSEGNVSWIVSRIEIRCGDENVDISGTPFEIGIGCVVEILIVYFIDTNSHGREWRPGHYSVIVVQTGNLYVTVIDYFPRNLRDLQNGFKIPLSHLPIGAADIEVQHGHFGPFDDCLFVILVRNILFGTSDSIYADGHHSK